MISVSGDRLLHWDLHYDGAGRGVLDVAAIACHAWDTVRAMPAEKHSSLGHRSASWRIANAGVRLEHRFLVRHDEPVLDIDHHQQR